MQYSTLRFRHLPVFLAVTCIVMTQIGVAQTITWEHSYSNPVTMTAGIHGSDILADGVVMVGPELQGNPGGVHLIKVDQFGAGPLWNVFYNNWTWGEDHSVARSYSSDKIYWTTGIDVNYGTFSLYHFHLSQVDNPTGFTDWTYYYTPIIFDQIHWSGSTSVIEMQQPGEAGNIVMAGKIQFPVLGSQPAFHIIKTDANGIPIWARVFSSQQGSFGADEAWCIREDEGGNLIVAGSGRENIQAPTIYNSEIMLMKLDGATGNPLWGPNHVKLYRIQDRYLRGLSLSIFPTPLDDYICVSGYHQNGSAGRRDVVAICLSGSTGGLLWDNLYDIRLSGANGNDIGYSVTNTVDRQDQSVFPPSYPFFTIAGETIDNFSSYGFTMIVDGLAGGLPVPGYTNVYQQGDNSELRHIDGMLDEPYVFGLGNAYLASGGSHFVYNEYLLRIAPTGRTACSNPVQDVRVTSNPGELDEVPYWEPCEMDVAPGSTDECRLESFARDLDKQYPPFNNTQDCANTVLNKQSDGAVRAEQPAAASFAVSPNPAKQGQPLFINLHDVNKAARSIRVSNLVGETLYRSDLEADGQTPDTIATTGWMPGVYTLTLVYEDGSSRSIKLLLHR